MNVTDLNPQFLTKMQHLLGDEYPAFLASYAESAHTGLRVNTLKRSVADFIKKSPFTLDPVGDYAPAGFRLQAGDGRPGHHPYHAAGLYYLQEPSAMAVARALAPQAGEWVLDLAAAPGGKSTHLAALMGDSGLLVANDVNTKRARLLAENLERWGTRNTIISSATPTHLADTFGAVFDRVLVDAPCSGEGMFRKQGAFEWSEDHVLACSRRQSLILHDAARLVRAGGWLVYSTCTFSPEEDEVVIGRFLTEYPAFELVKRPFAPSTGNPAWGDGNPDLERTTRLWPHQFAGEGHFIAVMQRTGDGEFGQKKPMKSLKKRPHRLSKEVMGSWRTFADSYLQVDFDEGRLRLLNGRYLHLLPNDDIDTGRLHLLRHGLPLGEIRKGRFKPSHALALALRPHEMGGTLNYAADDPAIVSYLKGNPLPDVKGVGWVLVTVDGHSLGWGKMANGRLQNHYPRGLRWLGNS